ncbi:MAG: hypothetical protein LC639_05790 [Idiomarina sp.]|nr:hypothetical protein [Idiomarina sp.]
MLTLKLKPNSALDLAKHVIPEFSPFTLLVRRESDRFDQLMVDDKAILEFEEPASHQQPLHLEVTVVLKFEPEELKHWLAVSISPKQQAIIHHTSYLCRHHKNEYGKLFHQLINDFCHSH